jgi:hypothetical protein
MGEDYFLGVDLQIRTRDSLRAGSVSARSFAESRKSLLENVIHQASDSLALPPGANASGSGVDVEQFKTDSPLWNTVCFP